MYFSDVRFPSGRSNQNIILNIMQSKQIFVLILESGGSQPLCRSTLVYSELLPSAPRGFEGKYGCIK
jgi:hypothetical protein